MNKRQTALMEKEKLLVGHINSADGYEWRVMVRTGIASQNIELCRTTSEPMAIFIQRACESYKNKVALMIIERYELEKKKSKSWL